MNPSLYLRCILAHDTGVSVTPGQANVLTGDELGGTKFLAAPFDTIPVLPSVAQFRGEIIGIVTGPDWRTIDTIAPTILQDSIAPNTEHQRQVQTDTATINTENDAPPRPDPTKPPDLIDAIEDQTKRKEAYEIVEGLYRTGLQLHMADAPLWVDGEPKGKGVHLTLPCQWPAHVRSSVATALGVPVRAVHLTCDAPSGNRDGALILPSILATIVGLVVMKRGEAVRISLRNDQSFISGGRAPTRVQWASRITEDGDVLSNEITARLNLGAYPILPAETLARLRHAGSSIYDAGEVGLQSHLETTPDIPMGAFEGTGTTQIAFAREVHWNRIAEIIESDPIEWRKNHLRRDWPVLTELCDLLAEEADFHRRYAANELIRKRRIQLPRDSAALRGIGCGFSESQSGFTDGREQGAITVRLNQDGTAHLFCSIPTPTLRLRTAWQQLVAQELGIERDAVVLETSYDSKEHDSGPRLFSRGVTLVPRAISLACQAIQKQRFREPLPISVRRTLRGGRGVRGPVDALQSVGGAAVEAVLRPASMEIDIRSVTMVIYAGRILDRGMAEAELRRGIYHALNWALHESLIDAELVGERSVLSTYNTAFRGAVPRIKIVFLNQIRKDGPVGIGEIPFNTVPAAVVSALTQATGLYLDGLPVRPADILRMLQED